jgi:hypothetical protein
MSNCPVFHLSARSGDGSLAFRRPGDEIIAKIDAISRSRTTSVRTASPVSIRICGERSSRSSMQAKSEIQGSLEIAKNALHQVEMRFPGSMHI